MVLKSVHTQTRQPEFKKKCERCEAKDNESNLAQNEDFKN